MQTLPLAGECGEVIRLSGDVLYQWHAQLSDDLRMGPPNHMIECALREHADEDHYGIFWDLAGCVALWVCWSTKDRDPEVYEMPDCTTADPDSGGCDLYLNHPGRHSWQ